GGILHARQLDHDAVGALTLHQRLGHAEFVDAVTYGGEVLANGVFADLGDLRLGQPQLQNLLATTLDGGQLEIAVILADQTLSLVQRFAVGKAELNATIAFRHAAVAHALLAQQALDFTFIDLAAHIQRLVHVDFQQEVHPAGQVQTELHRAGTQTAQPVGSGLRQVQRHNVVVAQRPADDVLGRQLVILPGQTNQATTTTLVDAGGLDLNPGIGQRLAGTINIRLLDAQRRAGTTDLHGRVIWIEIGNGIDQTDRQHGQN